MRGFRVILVNAALSAAVIAFAWLGLRADELWSFSLPGGLAYLGWPLLVAGALLILAAEATFLKVSRATGATGDPPPRLVTTGPFRHVRNPIYLGAITLLFAVAFCRSSPTILLAALAAVPGMAAYVRWFEEPRLERRFGDEYRRYREAVPRWLPRLRAGRGA
jgi:protein-S-isoprenylcysteine O-methyltransferase Ste14